MLPVFFAGAAWILALLGIGRMAARWLGPGAGPGTHGLLGLFVLAVVGTSLHLFIPISPPISAAMLLLGLGAFAWHARRDFQGISPALVLGLTALLEVFSVLNDFPVRHYDMGLYWLQSVKWTTESAQVPGLATLHARLGFNSSWFAVAAMLEHPLAVGKSGFLATTVLLFFGGWISIEGLQEMARGRRDFPSVLAASAALLCIACLGELGGHSPDTAGAVIGFAALISWARALDNADDFRHHAATAVVLSVFAFTIKISYVVLPAASFLFFLHRRRWLERDRRVAAGWLATALLLVTWIARGYLASGCPLFPSTVGCAPVSWATPASIAGDVSKWIRSWARAPGKDPSTVLGNWDWLPAWASGTLESRSVQMLLCVLGAASLVLVLLRVRKLEPGALPLWGATAVGAVFWFVIAPTPRFGWGYLFALALIPASEAVAQLSRRWPGRGTAGAITTAALLAAIWTGSESLDWLRLVPASAYAVTSWPRIPSGATHLRKTQAGDKVRVPLGSDQCWTAPIPCTPYFDPGISSHGIVRTTTAFPVHP